MNFSRWTNRAGERRYGLTPSAQVLIALSVVLLATSQILWWMLTSYFMVDRPSSISFVPNDGWCNAETQGFGVHCFGDYYYQALFALSSDPWDGNLGTNPYPALSLVPFKVLQGFAELLNIPRLGLIVFLLLILASLSSAAIWAMRGLSLDRMAIVLLVAGPVSTPALIALDRGNSTGLIVFPLLWFSVSILKHNRWQSVLALVLVSAIKPQFALLIFVVISLGWAMQVFVSVVSVALTQVLAYGFWPDAWPQSIMKSFTMTSGYQSYTYAADPYPPQLSFSSGFATIEFGLRSLFGSISIDSLSMDPTGLLAVRWQSTVAIVISLVVLLTIAVARSRLPLDLRLIVAIAVCSYATGTVFAYYGVTSIVIAALIIRPLDFGEPYIEMEKTPNGTVVKQVLTARVVARGMIVLTTAISLSTLPLPLFIPPEYTNSLDGIVFTTSYLSTIAWIVVVIACLVLGVLGKLKGQRLFYPASRAIGQGQVRELPNSISI